MRKTLLNKNIISIIIIYLVSRMLLLFVGFRPDYRGLGEYMQYLPFELLRYNLLESIFYMHIQPPLYNLMLGIIIKIFYPWGITCFLIIFNTIIGLLFCLSFYLILNKLNVDIIIKYIIVISLIFSPASIIFEFWLYFTYLVTALLVLSTFILIKFIDKPTFYSGFLFFTLLASIVLIRSLFHIFWILAIIIFLLIFMKNNKRLIIICSFIPLLIVLSVFIKNYLLFNSFSASSWLGMSFTKVTTLQVPNEKLIYLINKDKISSLSLIFPFSSIDKYKDYYKVTKTNISVLDITEKSSGYSNYNNKM